MDSIFTIKMLLITEFYRLLQASIPSINFHFSTVNRSAKIDFKSCLKGKIREVKRRDGNFSSPKDNKQDVVNFPFSFHLMKAKHFSISIQLN